MEFLRECLNDWQEVEDEWVWRVFSPTSIITKFQTKLNILESFNGIWNAERYPECWQNVEYFRIWVGFLGRSMAGQWRVELVWIFVNFEDSIIKNEWGKKLKNPPENLEYVGSFECYQKSNYISECPEFPESFWCLNGLNTLKNEDIV